MARDIIRTPNAPSPPPAYGKIVGDTIQEQTRQCLENVSAILKAAGTSLERVVSAMSSFLRKPTSPE